MLASRSCRADSPDHVPLTLNSWLPNSLGLDMRMVWLPSPAPPLPSSRNDDCFHLAGTCGAAALPQNPPPPAPSSASLTQLLSPGRIACL
eukprot:132735-Chlamydomonas_euryale.AAC.6